MENINNNIVPVQQINPELTDSGVTKQKIDGRQSVRNVVVSKWDTGAWTTPNWTVEVEINWTTYYLLTSASA